MSVWNIYHDPKFEINSFDVISETEIIIISSSNTTHNTGLYDIGVSLISSNFTCEWYYSWDVNKYNDVPTDIMIYSNYSYIISYDSINMVIYFIKFDHSNQKLKVLKCYNIFDSSISYIS